MELNEYQNKAMETCMPTCQAFSYMMLNLMGEVGEFAGKVAKHIRKGEATISTLEHRDGIGELYFLDSDVMLVEMEELKKECGDILWQIAGLAQTMGWSLEDVAQQNLAKLASRKQRGVIDGNGDNR